MKIGIYFVTFILSLKSIVMKKYILLSISFLVSCTLLNAQSQFTKDFQDVRSELVTWDAVRGEWLANSFEAMVNKQEIPDRTFPEDLTPMELYKLVPKENKNNIEKIVSNRSERADENVQKDAWRKVAVLTQTGNCRSKSARSYGDPHLKSFDGADFSFQTVGEFILAKSESGHFQVQARQSAQSDDFSLNTAVALNVSGDRVCFYANEMPDQNNSTPIRLNGNPLQLSTNTFRLPHGGTIVKNGKNDYVVNWPSGEFVVVDFRKGGKMNFINLGIEVIPCLNEQYNGVLGNANGTVNDDFKTSNGRDPKGGFVNYVSFGNEDMSRMAKQAEKEHLAYLAKDFANDWRVNMGNTLFDYGFGLNTFTYTDLSFPRVHRTLDDLTPNQRSAAKKSCEDAGITGSDLRGCIYDRGFLDIPANPRPVVRDRSEGVVLAVIEKPVEKTINAEIDKENIKEIHQESVGDSKNKGNTNGQDVSKKTDDVKVLEEEKTIPSSKSKEVETKENTFTFPKTTVPSTKKEPAKTPTPSPSKSKTPTPVSVPAPSKTKTSTPIVSPPPIKTGRGGR